MRDWALSFNEPVKIQARNERITGDAGAVTGREVPQRNGVVRWMARRLSGGRGR